MYRAKISITDTLHLATFCSATGDISNVVIASKLIASPDNPFYLFICSAYHLEWCYYLIRNFSILVGFVLFFFLQGLSDTEEFVVCKALNALTCLAELGLLQKPTLQELVLEIVPFLCHPVSANNNVA